MSTDDRPSAPARDADPAPADGLEEPPSAEAPPATGASGADTGTSEAAPGAPGTDAGAELRSALGHVRRAAGILLARAARDPALREASAEARRVVEKVGATAEPLARQLGVEAGRAAERLGASAEQLARQVASEAERLGAQIEADAEPVAEQMAEELSRFTKRMADVVQDGVDATRGLIDRDRKRPPRE